MSTLCRKDFDHMNITSSIQDTQNALGAVAAWMAQEANIKIVWNEGTECVADLQNKTLSIPRLVESDLLDGEKLWIARGHIYHEAGHVAETKLDKRVNNGGLHAVVNALEDRRMEHVMANRYAGCKIAFKKQLSHYSGELAKRFASGKLPAQYEALCALSFEVENIQPQWSLSSDADRICRLVRDDFHKVFDCKSSTDAVDLGIVIWDKIKKDSEEQSNKNQQSQDNQDGDNKENGDSESGDENCQNDENQNGENQSGENQNGENQNGENQNGESQNGENQNGDNQDGESQNGENQDGDNHDGESHNGENQNGESQNGKGKNGKSKSSKDGDSASSDETNHNESNSSNGESNGKSLEAMMAEAEGQCGLDAIEGEAFKKLLDEEAVRNANSVYTSYRAGDVHRTIEPNDKTRQSYKAALEECHGEAAILARTLEEYLRTITRTKMLHCQRSGKIDPRRFAVMAKGLSKEVFKKLSDKREIDTAVEIVFDESGSMGEYREVRKAIMIIAEALDRVGIPFEITGGTTLGGNYPDGFTRGNPIEYRHYKTFDQVWTRVRSSIEHSNAFHNFIDGEMIEFAAARLMSRPEKRKIIFSLSDGCPCGGEGHDEELGNKLIRVCSECRNHGIEVYSFGVDTEAPSQYYGRKYSVRLEGAEIGKGLSTGITSVMTKGHVA